MNFIKKNWIMLGMIAYVLTLTVLFPDTSFAASSTGQVQAKLNKGIVALQTVITGIIVAVGVFSGSKVVSKFLPSIDDPHSKAEMWKALGGVAIGVIAGASCTWIVPWMFATFK
ncbi:CagC family type IV secretion system protein [Bacillus inaquosorum]|uniref:CagC family type IV secretion system protein n=1 Tax=Bacillus inaquosorum TaxID=483913 RepID=UPI0022801E55|nr:CagC family type IV secretion system protein [Bacillus inaquosorum]MCY8056453.1 CagC family type IV secretion system protein [Bacillus inaquosorum]